jgi:hypothetical protein
MSLTAGTIVVHRVQGDVSVRHGVTEVWTKVAVGDVLRPDDTMKTGRKGSAVLVANAVTENVPGQKTISLPAEVIVDISDIRDLSQEELMLKLTMEKVRSSSYQWKMEDLHIPAAAAVHGTDRSPESLGESDAAMGTLQLNGARVLFDNGFFATCALKGMEVFRRCPSLAADFKSRLMVAESLEKAELRGEAISEYGALSGMAGLSQGQLSLVNAKLRSLRK